MMTRSLSAVLTCTALSLAACGEKSDSSRGSPTTHAGGASDAATDAGVVQGELWPDGTRRMDDGTLVGSNGTVLYTPIAADAPQVEGEGKACQLSVECGAFQVCVDDKCVRHERVKLDDVSLGELRTLDPNTARGFGLEKDDGTSDYFFYNWFAPSPLGARLVFAPRLGRGAYQYQAGPCIWDELGPFGYRHYEVSGDGCWGAAISAEGEVVTIVTPKAGPAQIVWKDSSGVELFRNPVPDDFVDPSGSGFNKLLVRSATSALFEERDVIFSVALGSASDRGEQRIAFVRATRSGELTLLKPGGAASIPGSRGWLVRDALGLHALVLERYNSDQTSAPSMQLIDVETGASKPLAPRAGASRYAQLTQSDWVFVADYTSPCTTSVQTSKLSQEFPRYPMSCEGGRDPFPLSPEDTDISIVVGLPLASTSAFVGHRDIPLFLTRSPFNSFGSGSTNFQPIAVDGTILSYAPVRTAFLAPTTRFGVTVEGIVEGGIVEYALRTRKGSQ